MLPYTFKIEISGLVQGVGFRPFVYTLALKHELTGEVYNDSKGVVIILQCSKQALQTFLNELKTQLPPLAKIERLKTERIKSKAYTSFKITTSKQTIKTSAMLSDFSLCEECEQEFYDTKNPRFHYPFITCTHCGVRFSIIKALPYDRKNTTMDKFKMCKDCEAEYNDPANRRFHAQPISCKKCKIKVYLKDKDKNVLADDESAFKQAALLLKEGKILAVKGLGGFHLMCDAFNPKAIALLRERKQRPRKSFALMCKDLQMALKLAFINQKEQELLESKIKPIVLLKAKEELEGVSLDTNNLGIMLAYTPFSLLLFEYFHNPLVATSANISSEGIIYESDKLYLKLGGVFDYVLDYERDIYNSSDDSIVQVIDDEAMFLRTSRAINPSYIELKDFKCFTQKAHTLALGAELKNQFALYFDNKILLSPYIGDLKSVDTHERFKKTLDFFIKTYDLKFECILADKHPAFSYVKDFDESKIKRIQHHYAHICALLFEYQIFDEKVLAFAFDGTGYADDGSIWGGEIFRADLQSYERIAHFDEFKLINADINNVKNLALSLIFKYDLKAKASDFLSSFDALKLKNLEKIHAQSKLITSSLGRIIDAFGALAFKLERLEYEAQIGLLMEKNFDWDLPYSYEFKLINNKICIKNAFKQALQDDTRHICTGFLNALADFICLYTRYHQRLHKEQVILCGGVFQNATLLKLLKKRKLEFKVALKFPPNDSSIALGQMIHHLFKPIKS